MAGSEMKRVACRPSKTCIDRKNPPGIAELYSAFFSPGCCYSAVLFTEYNSVILFTEYNSAIPGTRLHIIKTIDPGCLADHQSVGVFDILFPRYRCFALAEYAGDFPGSAHAPSIVPPIFK
uniref:Uncharacterized protein n=1 Tax=Candidatus Kentrum sp. FW TaxID=2126338 RepID=A0A450TJC5_9GAMM|nr:MAG: hypothetical protein BECKFW1821C_GA0114237_10126 [Candidatus Kentron sp. FW]